jgi:hypothetical protein
MSCVSILCYISDHLKYLPISVITHFLVEKDILMCFVPLIEYKPWIRNGSSGKREKWEEGKWTVIESHEHSKLCKIEGLLWIAVYNLLMNKETAERYEITDFRKGTLLRVSLYDLLMLTSNYFTHSNSLGNF